ncbi:MBL fold metallo-hydrolase, partial [Sphaerochaeta sp. S2]|uniref:MBL fold metallo-hydrolase n=1 Tax=Sphaerochaeta sp. S2 TaxID=2798868 RepID=UPI0018E971E6
MMLNKKVFLGIVILMVLLMLSCTNQLEAVVENETLLEEVDSEVEGLSVDLTYLGRASVRIDISDGRVLYIDPYAGSYVNYEEAADLVLVSHQHSDHNMTSKITLKEEGIIIACPNKIRAGDLYTLDDITIEAVSAYNSNHSASLSCGFVIKIGDIVIYHSGDTSTTDQMPEMSAMDIDYALLCMDGFYNMDYIEAMTVSDLIQASAVIPIHTSADYSYDINHAKAYANDDRVIVQPGETIRLYDLSETNDIAIPFEKAVLDILDNKLKALEEDNYKLYMHDITTENDFYYNEQERWFDEMTKDVITNIQLQLLSYEMLDDRAAVATILQTHEAQESFAFEYPLLFRYEDGRWKDYGYNFEEFETDRFTVK